MSPMVVESSTCGLSPEQSGGIGPVVDVSLVEPVTGVSLVVPSLVLVLVVGGMVVVTTPELDGNGSLSVAGSVVPLESEDDEDAVVLLCPSSLPQAVGARSRSAGSIRLR